MQTNKPCCHHSTKLPATLIRPDKKCFQNRRINIRLKIHDFYNAKFPFKGIVSAPTIFTYIIEWGYRTKNNILLSSSELDLTLKFSILSQISRNSRQWKVVTQSKTCQWKVGTNPKCFSEKWSPIQNLSVKTGYPIQNSSLKFGHRSLLTGFGLINHF